jgi:hypothetical protein
MYLADRERGPEEHTNDRKIVLRRNRKRSSKKVHLVWFGEIERKISQIINDYFYLPFFLLIIL